VRALRRLEDALARAERAVVCFLLGSLVVLAFLQVALRLAHIGFVWADTLLRHLVLAAGFMGAAVAAREEKHFAVDALARLLSPKAHAALAQLARLIGAGASVALAYASAEFVSGEWQSASVLFSIGGLRFPAAIFEAVLPLAFSLMAFHFAMRLGEPPKKENAEL
jgi:C4-dicarboxylate transporter DctQ subunit